MRPIHLILTTSLALPAVAQTDFDGTKQGFTWTGNCSSAVVFKNTSGVDLCDLWVAIGDDNANNAPEIKTITVTNSTGTADWDVDDNENGTDNDAGENDDVDSSPLGNAQGWHRAQAVGNGDCIAPDATFTLTLCDANGGSLEGRDVYLWGTTHSGWGETGGDNGVKIASPPKKLNEPAPGDDLRLPSDGLPGAPRFSFRLLNDGLGDLPRIRIVPEDPDFDLLNVRADQPAVWDPTTNTLNFTIALAPLQQSQLWLDLSNMSASATTDVHVVRLGDAPQRYCQPKINSAGCPPLIFSNGNPSATSPAPFWIHCQGAINQQSGLLFYGPGAHLKPFQGGTLCVKAPLHRTQLQNSGGSPPPSNCSGSFHYDFNALIRSGTDPLLAAGAEISTQWWYRDPPSASTTGLSDALHFVIDN